MTNKLYDRLKFLAQILLPALGALYFTLAGLWGLPAAEEVVGTITAVDAFLGVLLGISAQSYYNGDRSMTGELHAYGPNGEGSGTFSVNLPADASALEKADQVVLKVVNRTPERTRAENTA